MSNVNWENMNKYAPKVKEEKKKTVDWKNLYAKFDPGTEGIRIIPVGNYEENLFFKKRVNHMLKDSVGNVKGSILCWDEIGRDIEYLARPLFKMGLLTQPDYKKLEDHGCPFCSAKAWIRENFDMKDHPQATLLKTLEQAFYAPTQYLFNVVRRKNNKVQVWRCSKKIFDAVYNEIIGAKQANIDLIDEVAGFDIAITTTGTQQQTRYHAVFGRVASPMLMPRDAEPYNLMELVAMEFKGYQESINLLKEHYGKGLAAIGYEIPGDETYASPDVKNQINPDPDIPF